MAATGQQPIDRLQALSEAIQTKREARIRRRAARHQYRQPLFGMEETEDAQESTQERTNKNRDGQEGKMQRHDQGQRWRGSRERHIDDHPHELHAATTAQPRLARRRGRANSMDSASGQRLSSSMRPSSLDALSASDPAEDDITDLDQHGAWPRLIVLPSVRVPSETLDHGANAGKRYTNDAKEHCSKGQSSGTGGTDNSDQEDLYSCDSSGNNTTKRRGNSTSSNNGNDTKDDAGGGRHRLQICPQPKRRGRQPAARRSLSAASSSSRFLSRSPFLPSRRTRDQHGQGCKKDSVRPARLDHAPFSAQANEFDMKRLGQKHKGGACGDSKGDHDGNKHRRNHQNGHTTVPSTPLTQIEKKRCYIDPHKGWRCTETVRTTIMTHGPAPGRRANHKCKPDDHDDGSQRTSHQHDRRQPQQGQQRALVESPIACMSRTKANASHKAPRAPPIKDTARPTAAAVVAAKAQAQAQCVGQNGFPLVRDEPTLRDALRPPPHAQQTVPARKLTTNSALSFSSSVSDGYNTYSDLASEQHPESDGGYDDDTKSIMSHGGRANALHQASNLPLMPPGRHGRADPSWIDMLDDDDACGLRRMWCRVFPEACLLPELGVPSRSGGVVVITHRVPLNVDSNQASSMTSLASTSENSPDHASRSGDSQDNGEYGEQHRHDAKTPVIINGLFARSALAGARGYYSAERTGGVTLNLYRVTLPDLPGCGGRRSVVQCYVSALAAAGMGIATVNAATHWAGAVLFPSSVALVDVAHQSSEMDAFEFSRRTLVALDSAVQLARAGIARIEADPSSRQRALCALTIFPSSAPLTHELPSARDATKAVSNHLSRHAHNLDGAAPTRHTQAPSSTSRPTWTPPRVCVGDVFTRLGRVTEDEDERADPHCLRANNTSITTQRIESKRYQNSSERNNTQTAAATGVTVVEHDYYWNAEHQRWDKRS